MDRALQSKAIRKTEENNRLKASAKDQERWKNNGLNLKKGDKERWKNNGMKVLAKEDQDDWK